MYLTSSVKHRLFSYDVDVKKESGVFAQLLLYLPSLILFLPLTVLWGSEVTPLWAASLQGREKEERANLEFLSVFQEHLVLPWLCPDTGAQGLAGTVTRTHLAHLPQTLTHQSLELIPLHSTAPHSCRLVLEPLVGIHTSHRKSFMDCSLQDVLAHSRHTHTKSNGTRIAFWKPCFRLPFMHAQ